ncbi:MAG: pitrilysin family protein, partial [Elusimicrobiota bacterium]
SWALEAVLWAESDRMRGLLISPRELEIEKRVVLEEMHQSYSNQPYRRATDVVMGELAFFRWEAAHSTIGDETDLRAATLEDVRRFYDRHYAPNNAVLALVGDLSVSEGRRLVLRHFGPIPRRARPRPRDLSEPRLQGEKRRRVSDPLAKNPLLVAGWHTPRRGSRDYWGLMVLAGILGGGEDSPLHEELVKRLRLALSASGHMPYWSSHYNARGTDLFGIFVTARADADLGAVLKALDQVLKRFLTKGPTEDELSRAKIQIERSWLEGQQSLGDRAQTRSSYAALVGAPSGFARDFRLLLKTSRADVRRAAKRWLGSRGRVVMEVVPGSPVAAGALTVAAVPPEAAPRGPSVPPPTSGPVRPLVLPRLARFRLSNGLDVLLVRDARLPFVEARLALPSGRAHESAEEEGLSPACEELILKGCEGQDGAALARAFMGLGWAVGTTGEAEWLKFSASGLARNFDAFCAQLFRVLSTANYPEDELALWRENAVEELAMRRAQPSFLAEERLRSELFDGHPYSRGALDEAAITAVSADRLRSYHAARLRPAGGCLVLAGDLHEDEARRTLEKSLSSWTAGAAPASLPPLPDHGRARTVLVPRPGSAQATLVVAQTMTMTPHDSDHLDFVVANHVLGGTANSRLFENLRTRRGYTYGAYSSMEVYGKGTVWSAGADVRSDSAPSALVEIHAEAERLRSQPIAAEVLSSSKRHLAGLFLMRLASLDRVASYLAAVVESGRDPAAVMTSYQARLAAVTPESAQAAVRRRLDCGRFVAVVVGEDAALRPALGL